MLHLQDDAARASAELQYAECKILVVDDNPQILDVVEDILLLGGFEVLVANHPNEALQLLDLGPDLILCDVMMPGMDGYGFYQEILKNPEWCNIPFLFLTALGSPDQVRRAKEMGCDDYLVKPFDPPDLLAAVRGKVTTARRRTSSVEERMETYRRRIIHTLSHEFRTPLVAINTGAELLIERLEEIDGINARRLLESIHRGGKRLQRLVEDFMTLQQIDAGFAQAAYKRNKRVVPLAQIARRSQQSFEDQAVAEQHSFPQLDLQLAPEAADAMVEVYEMHINDALQRILGNALKFGGKDNPVQLRVQLGEADETVSLIIRDYGKELPDVVWKNAQILFAQIDRERNEQQGCGLGLSIASYFVEMNRGRIYFHRPADGRGLEVEMRFPIAKRVKAVQA